MYQVNIPMIYYELEKRNSKQMSRVLLGGSTAAVVLYIIVGIFGYLTFVSYPGGAEVALEDKNILEAPYKPTPESPQVIPILIGNFALFFAIATAAPLCVLPAKDTVEEIYSKGDQNVRLSSKQNLFVTLGIVTSCYLLAIAVPNIGDAMTLVGSTTNPAVGFILPILFYWKTLKNTSIFSCEKMVALIVAIVIIAVSCMSLVNFFITL